ncbi:hypothetical protein [Chitinophaga solisilvae]|uniref:hypothetical protein n=1 Tax=Chitinophaga solisilvae TaxID=1233460 RepID=UPI00136EBFED|nr:hypothetical protein [Chitinophaga solisilvae]
MYILLFIVLAFTLCYAWFRIRTIKALLPVPQEPIPVKGEDAIQAAVIEKVTGSAFSVSKYQRNIRNSSTDRFITVAINEVIKTNMGATYKPRLIKNLAPGEARRLGHADTYTEGRHTVFIGYEIIWARFTPTPEDYKVSAATAVIQPAALHPVLLKELEQQFRENGYKHWM